MDGALLTAAIFSHPFHRLHGVDAPCDRTGGCVVCEGGLAACTRCGGAEASLTSDCPGWPMHPEVADAVQEGWLDYSRRRGWVLVDPKDSPSLGMFVKRDERWRWIGTDLAFNEPRHLPCWLWLQGGE